MWRASSGERRACWPSADPRQEPLPPGSPLTRVCTGASHAHAPPPSGAGRWGSAPSRRTGPSALRFAFYDVLGQVRLGFRTAPPDLPGAPLGSRDGLGLCGVSVLGRWLTGTPGEPARAGGTASAPHVQPRGCGPRACFRMSSEAGSRRGPHRPGVIGAAPGPRPRGPARPAGAVSAQTAGSAPQPTLAVGAGPGAAETVTAAASRSLPPSRKSHLHTDRGRGKSHAGPAPRALTAGPAGGALAAPRLLPTHRGADGSRRLPRCPQAPAVGCAAQGRSSKPGPWSAPRGQPPSPSRAPDFWSEKRGSQRAKP